MEAQSPGGSGSVREGQVVQGAAKEETRPGQVSRAWAGMLRDWASCFPWALCRPKQAWLPTLLERKPWLWANTRIPWVFLGAKLQSMAAQLKAGVGGVGSCESGEGKTPPERCLRPALSPHCGPEAPEAPRPLTWGGPAPSPWGWAGHLPVSR